jgi:hypothetical protein
MLHACGTGVNVSYMYTCIYVYVNAAYIYKGANAVSWHLNKSCEGWTIGIVVDWIIAILTGRGPTHEEVAHGSEQAGWNDGNISCQEMAKL